MEKEEVSEINAETKGGHGMMSFEGLWRNMQLKEAKRWTSSERDIASKDADEGRRRGRRIRAR